MTRPVTESRSPGPLANTLPTLLDFTSKFYTFYGNYELTAGHKLIKNIYEKILKVNFTDLCLRGIFTMKSYYVKVAELWAKLMTKVTDQSRLLPDYVK